MSEINALAVMEPKGKLEPYFYDPEPLGEDEVEIEVQYCGICHSDLSMMLNEWNMTQFPLIPGHEVIGKVCAVGSRAKIAKLGQTVGLGWNSRSCLSCHPCLTGDHNMCNTLEQTIVGRHGGFATRVRCHWAWATPIPDGLDPAKAGPLLCGGVTVFNPLLQFDVKPTDRVGVIGIGGLGHLALQFLNKWGCEVTAFTTSDGKTEEAKRMGAHRVMNTHAKDELKKAAGSFDFILSTVAARVDVQTYLSALKPRGHFHVVGMTPNISVGAAPLISKQRSIAGSPSGAPATVMTMLNFCARHHIEPITEEFAMSEANDALEHLQAGKARYRIVLKADLHKDPTDEPSKEARKINIWM